MGEDIQGSSFSAGDFDEFRIRLRDETNYLMQLFEDMSFDSCRDLQIGIELETWLADSSFLPAPENKKFLSKMASPLLVPELSKFNAELNMPPFNAQPGSLNKFLSDLGYHWRQIQAVSHDLGLHTVMIGSMPTLKDVMLTPRNMSDSDRFRALNDQVFALRSGRPLKLNILGTDYYHATRGDIMLEAAATSLQIHLRPPPESLVRYFNASSIASMPLVAVAANTPYLFGKKLWEESRIPIFEQSAFLPSFRRKDGEIQGRVTLGTGYVSGSLRELFWENVNRYPILLPVLFDSELKKFKHVRFHNGSIWRWNRPVLDVDDQDLAHIRIEQRVPAAGPTVIDIVANLAFYIGLTHQWAIEINALESMLPFETLRRNFYLAAQFGFAAEVEWIGGKKIRLQSLIVEDLLPRARTGLLDIGFEDNEVEQYLTDVLLQRVKSGKTGAVWQRNYIAKHGPDFQAMTAEYFGNQERGEPVHTWHV